MTLTLIQANTCPPQLINKEINKFVWWYGKYLYLCNLILGDKGFDLPVQSSELLSVAKVLGWESVPMYEGCSGTDMTKTVRKETQKTMSTLSYKTISANKNTVKKEWVLVDAENQTVGRLATRVANILRGKTKPCYTPHVDCGDNVIIINAEKIVFTGKKMTDKIYQHYTGYPGGQRETTPAKVLATHPERILEHAIRGMLPKNRLGAALYRNLYIYAGSEHPHQGQNPKVININDIR